MANTVEFGLSNVHVAFLNETTGAYGTPIAIPGAVKVSLAPEGDETEFYADNIPYFLATSNQGYKGDAEQALLPDAVLAEALGWEVDDNGMLVEVADGTQKYFALMCEIEGDSAKRRAIYYKVQAGRPNSEHSTKTKSIEPQTQSLPIKAVPVIIDDRTIVKASMTRTSGNASVFDNFFSAVVEPTFAASA